MSEFSSLNGYDVKDATARSAISEAQGDIQNLESARQGIIGVSRQQDTNDYWIIYSPDYDHFYTCGEKLPDGVGSDASSLFKIGDTYYYMYSNGYRMTTDLQTWSDNIHIPSDKLPGRRMWANTLYHDEDTGIVYIYSAFQYNDDTATNTLGRPTYYFKIVYQTATIDPDTKQLIIDPTTHDLIYNEGSSYIDPYVIKDSRLGLVIAYKDELETNIYTATMSSPTSVNNGAIGTPAIGIEAPQLMEVQDQLICFFHMYTVIHTNVIHNGEAAYPPAGIVGYFYVRLLDNYNMVSQSGRGLIPINSTTPLRHPGLMPADAGALNLIQKIGVNTAPSIVNNNRNSGNYAANGAANVGVPSSGTLTNLPCLNYILHQSYSPATVTLRPILKYEPFRFFLTAGTTITWSEDSAIQSSCKGKSYTAQKSEWHTIYPDARDALGGMFVPVDPEQ